MTAVGRHRSRPGQVRLARDCWIDETFADDVTARCAAVLETTTDGVISSVTAARLHGMWLPELPPALHVATATPDRAGRGMTRTKRSEFVAHRLQLRPDDIALLGGLPVTTAARTWRDLAAVVGLADLVAAGDSVLRAGTSIEELTDIVERTRRARFARTAKAALPLLDARSRSRPESHLRVAATAPDLPRFEVNEPVFRGEGGWLAEPDLSLAEAKIALEYQGKDHADLDRMRADITRATDLRTAGWLCLPYGPAQVFGRPWQIAPELRGWIQERAPHLLRARRRRQT